MAEFTGINDVALTVRALDVSTRLDCDLLGFMVVLDIGLTRVSIRADTDESLTAVEQAVLALGAVVSVVPRTPGQPVDLLTCAGYKRTTDFFTRLQSPAV